MVWLLQSDLDLSKTKAYSVRPNPSPKTQSPLPLWMVPNTNSLSCCKMWVLCCFVVDSECTDVADKSRTCSPYCADSTARSSSEATGRIIFQPNLNLTLVAGSHQVGVQCSRPPFSKVLKYMDH